MNIFGIGPLEIIFVLIIGILFLGPEGMIEAGQKLGKFMSSTIRSSWWQNVRRGVNEIQHLPQRLMREAELEELNEIKKLTKDSLSSIGNKDLINASSWAGNTPSLPAQEKELEPGPEKDSALEKNTN
jgi:Sec-independent protein translocase protein TatA